MVLQVLWYNRQSRRRRKSSLDPSRRPLLGSDPRRTSSATRHYRRRDSSTLILPRPTSLRKTVIQNTVALVLITATGTAGYFVSRLQQQHSSASPRPSPPSDGGEPIGPIILGYLSALAYLSARLPQIYQNYKRKSCEGLAVLFFIFACLGNTCYVVSILAASSDRDYLIKSLPWILGAVIPILEDCLIFAQFHWYKPRHHDSAIAE